METRELLYGKIKLVISRANSRMGTRRTRLFLDGQKYIEQRDAKRLELQKAGEPVPSPDEFEIEDDILRLYVYPDLVSVVVSAEGFSTWPIPFEEFAGIIDDGLVSKWEALVYELNPHWQAKKEDTDPKGNESKPQNSTGD